MENLRQELNKAIDEAASIHDRLVVLLQSLDDFEESYIGSVFKLLGLPEEDAQNFDDVVIGIKRSNHPLIIICDKKDSLYECYVMSDTETNRDSLKSLHSIKDFVTCAQLLGINSIYIDNLSELVNKKYFQELFKIDING